MFFDDRDFFAPKTVLEWEPDEPFPDLLTTIPRFSFTNTRDHVDAMLGVEKFQAFLAHPASRAATGLVFGMVSDETENYTDEILETLLKHREQLQQLTSLFLGDISSEESEISWIKLGDVSALFTAYPQLEHVHIRGCATSYAPPGLRLGVLHHEHLKTLIIETGSMDRSVVHDVLRSHLPALEHLELWTGAESYGANLTVEDFALLFTATLFPNLRYLGLRNSEIASDLAIALSQSPVLEQLRVLDLSLGWLDDVGAMALLNCPAIHKLEKLDLHHHYCSQEMMRRIQALGIEVDTSEQQEPDFYDGEEQRYVAVSE